MSYSQEHYLTQLIMIFLSIKLLGQQAKILIAAFNSILIVNGDEIVYSIRHNSSNSFGQWYCFLILQCIMILSLPIRFCKLKTMKLLSIELYLISNRMIISNLIINYVASSNSTLILFRILLIILIFENSDYIQVYYKIRQWHRYLLLQLVLTILFPSISFCKWKTVELLIIELYLISNGMIVNIYGVLSKNTLTLFTILLRIFIYENKNYCYYYIQLYYKIRQWNLINIASNAHCYIKDI